MTNRLLESFILTVKIAGGIALGTGVFLVLLHFGGIYAYFGAVFFVLWIINFITWRE